MSLSVQRAAEILSRFPRMKIAVVGDFVADVYLEAHPTRLSREAPVMIVTWQGERLIAGGAANAVHNLVALGAEVFPVGVLGSDREGRWLFDFFRSHVASTDGILIQEDYGTVSKTRIMVGAENRSRQQVLRVDREPDREVRSETRARAMEVLRTLVPEVDAVLFSDYGYNFIDRDVVELVLKLSAGKTTAADSRYHLPYFNGVTVVTPNHGEAAELVGRPVGSDEQTESACRELRSRLNVQSAIITRGNRGMMLLNENDQRVAIPAAGSPDEVTDVTGAGDTVISVVTLALSAGASFVEAANLSNFAAGVVVGKMGAATCSPEELMGACTRQR